MRPVTPRPVADRCWRKDASRLQTGGRVRPRARRWSAGLAVVIASLAVTRVVGCGPGIARGVEVGDQVPEYKAPDLDGVEIALDDLRGKVVLINVWATWCGPCRVEMPPIQRSYDRFKERGFTVIAVSIDAGPGYREKVSAFAEEFELKFPILLDPDGRIARVLQTVGVPETFVVDREGKIVKRLIGAADWDSPANQALIEQLLGM